MIFGTRWITKPENDLAVEQRVQNQHPIYHDADITAKLISAFVFATWIVHFLFFLNPKFQGSSLLLLLHRPVCVGPVRKPHCWFSHEAAQLR